MKPILIVQHEADTGPGSFLQWANAQGLPTQIVRVDQGETVPASPQAFAGICSLGGSMSVNDPLPWIEAECALMRAADRGGVPIIGHCLGGQLLARALGGRVQRNPVKEIGWGDVRATDVALATEWMGDVSATFRVFQWHGDTFEPPPGARSFLASEFCAQQAFVIDRGRFAHLGMQFHCEMTPALVRDWVRTGAAEVASERAMNGGPAAQEAADVLIDVDRKADELSRLAARLYARWARGLAD
jgi:GMP synthase-like glutamine amidotransferase